MKIYFAQHGHCVDKQVNEARPLSHDGEQEVLQMAAFLARAHVPVSQVCHSGKLRAKQTAELFARSLGVSEVAEQTGMGPNDDARHFIATLNEPHVLYVGHLPHLDQVLSTLVAGDASAQVLAFSQAGVVCVDKDERGGRILWYATPAIAGPA